MKMGGYSRWGHQRRKTSLSSRWRRTEVDKALNITESANILDKYGTVDTRKVRQVLREKAFQNWSQKKHKDKGVLLYQQYTLANKCIRNHKGLSCSEWREAIKMTANVSAVRSVPGRSSGSNLFRRCDREVETLAHVLGACPHGELLRNTRHHTVSLHVNRILIRTCKKEKEEVGEQCDSYSIRSTLLNGIDGDRWRLA
ncbi:hypothetical protein ANN_08164 [Periplaneta americana]|uniref:Uncharacterized protein n=1 Tax=Periplaneta americana TaxID=6978 RepID=A0ABQ8T1B7_PERAM|nr:hypothetical protein ANN_08164 [Periplaneta americana]